MNLEFKKYEGTGSTLESVKIIDVIGAKGSIRIPRKSYEGEKRIFAILVKEDGTSAGVVCSEDVSKGIRDKSITAKELASFVIINGGDKGFFIARPSKGFIELKMESIVVDEFIPSVMNYEELAC